MLENHKNVKIAQLLILILKIENNKIVSPFPPKIDKIDQKMILNDKLGTISQFSNQISDMSKKNHQKTIKNKSKMYISKSAPS